jgi:hypothetical protein
LVKVEVSSAIPHHICALEVPGLFLVWDKNVKTHVLLKNSVFWDVTPCSPVKGKRRFGGTCLRSACSLLYAVFLFGLFFGPEDGGDIFFQNIA